MRFKEWLLNEAGHTRLEPSQDIMVLLSGRPVVLRNVSYVDPRFEDWPDANKPTGAQSFSLPLADGRWITSDRTQAFSLFSGTGKVDSKAMGIAARRDWADFADFGDETGQLMKKAG